MKYLHDLHIKTQRQTYGVGGGRCVTQYSWDKALIYENFFRFLVGR